MKSLTYIALVCNSWISRHFADIGQEINPCPSCASVDTLRYSERCCYVSRWHIHVPEDWEYGIWNQVRLSPVQVPQPVLCCLVCNEYVKVVPSFLLKGTTLTLTALVFIIFAYEISDLSWRKLPKEFCDKGNRIAHSTLYIAAHSLGKLMEVGGALEELRQRYLPFCRLNEDTEASVDTDAIEDQTLVTSEASLSEDENVCVSVTYLPPDNQQQAGCLPLPQPPTSFSTAWPPPKSRFSHTQTRERGARRLVAELLWFRSANFLQAFFRHVDRLGYVFANRNKPLPKLYCRSPGNKRKAA